MKTVLIISYFAPPLGGPGVQRIQKFIKYLPKFGWKPIVITVKNVEYIAYDYSLLDEIKDAVIYRTESLDLMRLLYLFEKLRKSKTNNKRIYNTVNNFIRNKIRDIFPIDSKIGWLPFAIKKSEEICKIRKIDAVFATIGPYTSAIVAYKIANKFNLPLIIDYRDLWRGKPDITYFSEWHKKISIKWEKRILEFSQNIIVNTEYSKQKIVKLFLNINKSKFRVLYNGWDANDFNFNKKIIKKDKIIFTYTGGFYGERTPYYFLRSLDILCEKNLLPDNVEFRFIGNYLKNISDMFNNVKCKKNLKIIPQVSHKESIKYLLESNFLLLFIAKKNSEIVLPAKIFEYLASQKPILAMIPEKSEAAEIILKYNVGLISEIDDIKAIGKHILKLIDLDKTNRLEAEFNIFENDYLHFERKHQTGKLAEILNQTVK